MGSCQQEADVFGYLFHISVLSFLGWDDCLLVIYTSLTISADTLLTMLIPQMISHLDWSIWKVALNRFAIELGDRFPLYSFLIQSYWQTRIKV
jgi:hypothetical protein